MQHQQEQKQQQQQHAGVRRSLTEMVGHKVRRWNPRLVIALVEKVGEPNVIENIGLYRRALGQAQR